MCPSFHKRSEEHMEASFYGPIKSSKMSKSAAAPVLDGDVGALNIALKTPPFFARSLCL